MPVLVVIFLLINTIGHNFIRSIVFYLTQLLRPQRHDKIGRHLAKLMKRTGRPVSTAPAAPVVPFTRPCLDRLRELSTRFAALARPLPDYAIIELAVTRLYHEYCLYANEIQVSDPASVKLIKAQSRAVLEARYREHVTAARPQPNPAKNTPVR